MKNQPMSPKELVELWVEAFNQGDDDAIAQLYAENAINHQVAETPVEGKVAIREMFAREFANAEMVCLVENIFEDGEWAILEWKDPLGLRGCGFFHSPFNAITGFPGMVVCPSLAVLFTRAQL